MLPITHYNVLSPSKFEEIFDIKFAFTKDKFNTRNVNNILTFDTETSMGFRLPNGHVIARDNDRYENDEEYQKFIDSLPPVSTTYLWQTAIEDGKGGVKVFIGRTMDEYDEFMNMLTKEIKRQSFFGFDVQNDREHETKFACLRLKSKVKLKIFVHNLAYDYQVGLRNTFEEKMLGDRRSQKIFAREMRKPMKIKFTYDKGMILEYVDTLVLAAGMSLGTWLETEHIAVQKGC